MGAKDKINMSITYGKGFEDKLKIKTSVRLNKDNGLELFYYDEYLNLVSFTFKEGHNGACLAYMYQCKPVSKEYAESFLCALPFLIYQT